MPGFTIGRLLLAIAIASPLSAALAGYGTDDFREKWERVGLGLSVPVGTDEEEA